MTKDATPLNPSSLLSEGVVFQLHRLSLFNFRLFSTPFQGTFQLSLAVLVRYRTWIMFRVGSWYSHVHAQINEHYSGNCIKSSSSVFTGVSPFCPARSSALQNTFRRQSSPNTTSPLHCCNGFGLLCTVFVRHYSRHLIDFFSCGY